MIENKEKKRYKYISIIALFGIVFSLIAISSSGNIITNIFPQNSIWKIINNDTIVQNDTSLNVNIGENASTPYKLDVHGDVNISGILNVGSAVNFLNSVYMLDLDITNSAIIQGDLTVDGEYYAPTGNSVNMSALSMGYGIVPIGTVEDFFGDAYGLPVPDGWQICNGSFITDVDSMLYGYQTPNLTGYFLKGGISSNITGGNNSYILTLNQIPAHNHGLPTTIITGGISSTRVYPGTALTVQSLSANINANRTNGNNEPFDNQPSYYTCIKIMRIK